ncbi:hypothetical protein HK405_011499, partial [Cladochytrium tenue]
FPSLASYADDVRNGRDDGVPYCPTMPECSFYFSTEFSKMAEEADALVTDKTSGIIVHNASLHFTKVGIVPHPHKPLEDYEWYGTEAHAAHLPMLSRHQAYSRPVHIPLYSVAETQTDFTRPVDFSQKLPVMLFVLPPEASCETDPARREGMIGLARQLRRESMLPIKFIVPNRRNHLVARGGGDQLDDSAAAAADEPDLDEAELIRGGGRVGVPAPAPRFNQAETQPPGDEPIVGNCDMMSEILLPLGDVHEVPNLNGFNWRTSSFSRRALMTALGHLEVLCPPPASLTDKAGATFGTPQFDYAAYDRYTRCLLDYSMAVTVVEPVPEPRLISDWVFKAQTAGTQVFHLGAKPNSNDQFALATLFPGGPAVSIEPDIATHQSAAGDTIIQFIKDMIRGGTNWTKARFRLKGSYEFVDRAPVFPTQLMTFMATGSKLSFPCRVCAHVKIKKSSVQCALSVVKGVADKALARRKRQETERAARAAAEMPAASATPPVVKIAADDGDGENHAKKGNDGDSDRAREHGRDEKDRAKSERRDASTAPTAGKPALFPWAPPARWPNETWGPVSTSEFLHPSERVHGLPSELSDVLDQIYVMHYSKTAVRRAHISEVMRNLSAEAYLIMDLDREDMSAAAYRCLDWSLSPATSMDPLRVYKNGQLRPTQMRRGEMSLLYKNVLAWYLMLQHNQNYALVVEDDAGLEAGADALLLGQALRYLPPNYSVMHVGTCSAAPRARAGQERRVEVTLGSRCTGAYALSKQGAIVLFRNFPLRVAVDLQMIDVSMWSRFQYGITRHPDYRNFYVEPAILRPSADVNTAGSTGIRRSA